MLKQDGSLAQKKYLQQFKMLKSYSFSLVHLLFSQKQVTKDIGKWDLGLRHLCHSQNVITNTNNT